MRELTYLGRTNWRGGRRRFGIHLRDRMAHTYIVGKTGTGKSSLLEALMRQDILSDGGIAVLDPHGDLAERLMAWIPSWRMPDVIYLDVPNPEQPFRFNPIADVPPLQRSLVANGIVEALKKIFADSWGWRLEHILRASLLLLLDQDTATIADVLRLLTDDEFRDDAIGRATNPHVKDFWTREFSRYGKAFRTEAIAPIQNKIGSFLVDPFISRILTTPTSSFDPRTVMDRGQVLIVNLAKGKIGEAPAMLFGSLLVSAFATAALARSNVPPDKRRPFFLYADEFQTFTTLALASMLSELRKFNLGLLLSSQYLEQAAPEVRSAILGNAATLIVFRVGASDATKLAKELGNRIEIEDLTLLPNRAFWIRLLVHGQAYPPFTGTTLDIEPATRAPPDNA